MCGYRGHDRLGAKLVEEHSVVNDDLFLNPCYELFFIELRTEMDPRATQNTHVLSDFPR